MLEGRLLDLSMLFTFSYRLFFAGRTLRKAETFHSKRELATTLAIGRLLTLSRCSSASVTPWPCRVGCLVKTDTVRVVLCDTLLSETYSLPSRLHRDTHFIPCAGLTLLGCTYIFYFIVRQFLIRHFKELSANHIGKLQRAIEVRAAPSADLCCLKAHPVYCFSASEMPGLLSSGE